MLEIMLHKAWLAWAIVAVILFIAEMALPYFACIFVAAAAVTASLAAAAGCNSWFQLGIFAASAVISLVLIRPKMMRTVARSPGVPHRVDEFIGQNAEVTHGTTKASDIGRVLVHGQDWAAQSDHIFSVGDFVQITGSNGIHLIVRKLK